jgi:dipeptidyl aminopeptidase/acylaminoacyl peptidase
MVRDEHSTDQAAIVQRPKGTILPLTYFSLGFAALTFSAIACAAPFEAPPMAPVATAAAPTATTTPSPSATPSLTPTPTLHPLTIESMRQRQYPGSDIVIEQSLDPGANYSRMIASYRSEGLKINGLLTIPYGQPPPAGWPVIIFNHGFIPPDVYQTTERYVAYVDHLARNGYIVFRPDYRGHADSEGEASGAYGSPDYVVDVLNAVAAMRRFPAADPTRVGMWGHSMGGYITLRAMVIDPDLRAGVIWAGVVASYPDLLTRWRRTPVALGTPTRTPSFRSWRGGLLSMYGSPEENPEFWNSISANSYLQDLAGPVQLHHGTADSSVPVEFSEILYDQIIQAGGQAELYLYEGADHNLTAPFTAAMQRTIEFFNSYLK